MSKKHAFSAVEVPGRVGSSYPTPFNAIAPNRVKRAIGDRAGLTQYGVNLVVLPAGESSSLRHWHRLEDEFVYVLDGELVLITDDGEETLKAGDCAGFPAGVENGHHFVNRSDDEARYLEIGSRADGEECFYPDADLHVITEGSSHRFTNKKGDPL
jgi:uncharacterized cupin superfamily protein